MASGSETSKTAGRKSQRIRYKKYLRDHTVVFPRTTERARLKQFMRGENSEQRDALQPCISMESLNSINMDEDMDDSGNRDCDGDDDSDTDADNMRNMQTYDWDIPSPQERNEGETDDNSEDNTDYEARNGEDNEADNGEDNSDDHDNEAGSGEDNSDDNEAGHRENIQGDDPLYLGSTVSKGQSLLLLVSHVLRHHIDGTQLQDLLTLLEVLFPGTFPSTKYLLSNCTNSTDGVLNIRLYCSLCQSLLPNDLNIQHGICVDCGSEYQVANIVKQGHFCLMIALGEQIKSLLERYDDEDFVDANQKTHSDDIVGPHNGDFLLDAMRADGISQDDLTLLWNCDGVPVFKSTQFAIWPIQVVINELKPKLQKENVLIAGMWFGTKKPRMDTFLQPFAEECVKLSTDGVFWRPNNAIRRHTKVHTLICSSDAVARPMLRNCKQFNGLHGCDWCKHPGEMVRKGDGFMRCFPFTVPEPEKRTAESQMQDALEAVRTGESAVNGVKGPSVLYFIPYFNIVRGFVPDYLHCVLLGVVRYMTSLWFDSSNNNKPWYIGRQAELVSNKLKNIRPPKEITRLPRRLDDRRFWKGSEWRSFLLFYALPVLYGQLPARYINHFFLLLYAIHYLLRDRVERAKLEKIHLALCKFVIYMEELYGKEHITFNVHQLSHLVDSVRDFGPLWNVSCFVFEGNNGALMKYFHGTRHVPVQICKRFLMWRDLPKQAKTCLAGADKEVLSLFDSFTAGCQRRKNATTLEDGTVLLGVPLFRALGLREKLAVERFFNIRLPGNLVVPRYDRFMTPNGTTYDTETYNAKYKRNNSAVKLDDETYGVVKDFILVKGACVCEGGCDCPRTGVDRARTSQ